MRIINIAKDFSMFPGGRTEKDGPNNGQKFRTNFIIPFLKNKEHIIIELDGTRGYDSSFLEEVFGGLIKCGYNEFEIHKYISFVSSRKGLIKEIESYISQIEG